MISFYEDVSSNVNRISAEKWCRKYKQIKKKSLVLVLKQGKNIFIPQFKIITMTKGKKKNSNQTKVKYSKSLY